MGETTQEPLAQSGGRQVGIQNFPAESIVSPPCDSRVIQLTLPAGPSIIR